MIALELLFYIVIITILPITTIKIVSSKNLNHKIFHIVTSLFLPVSFLIIFVLSLFQTYSREAVIYENRYIVYTLWIISIIVHTISLVTVKCSRVKKLLIIVGYIILLVILIYALPWLYYF